MSLEQQLIDSMKSESDIIAVRKVATLGQGALLDRVDVLDAAKNINLDQSTSLELKSAARRHELRKHLEKSRALDAAIKGAEDEIARSVPPIPSAETTSAVAIDTELRAHFRSTHEDQRGRLLKDSPETLLAVARGPRHLVGMIEADHAGLRDAVLRATYPDAMAKHDADRRVLDAVKQARDMHKQTAQGTFGTPIERFAEVITTAA